MWLCPSSCDRFSPPGSNPTYLDHGLGNSFIQAALPGRQWNYGDKLVVCNGQACFVFEYRGGGFFATGRAFQDPHVGYATPPASAPNGMSGGGGGYSGASRVLAPNVTYRSGGGMRTGHVTVHWGPGVGVTSQK
jgi:hypothetical protein